MAAIVGSDIKTRLSTTSGSAGNSTAGTPGGSLGKYMSTTDWAGGSLNDLFDDISGAATSVPPLSTLRVDKEALGAAGVDLLLRLKPEDPIEELVLPVDLVVRESSCDD